MIPLESYDGKERRREVAEFRKAVKHLGMQTALTELIDWCEGFGCADFIKRLKADLKTAQENYNRRHDNEE